MKSRRAPRVKKSPPPGSPKWEPIAAIFLAHPLLPGLYVGHIGVRRIIIDSQGKSEGWLDELTKGDQL